MTPLQAAQSDTDLDTERGILSGGLKNLSIQAIDEQLDFGDDLERAVMDNPDLSPGFVYDILISKAQGRTFAEPFIPE